jgi:hypothetical protein
LTNQAVTKYRGRTHFRSRDSCAHLFRKVLNGQHGLKVKDGNALGFDECRRLLELLIQNVKVWREERRYDMWGYNEKIKTTKTRETKYRHKMQKSSQALSASISHLGTGRLPSHPANVNIFVAMHSRTASNRVPVVDFDVIADLFARGAHRLELLDALRFDRALGVALVVAAPPHSDAKEY